MFFRLLKKHIFENPMTVKNTLFYLQNIMWTSFCKAFSVFVFLKISKH